MGLLGSIPQGVASLFGRKSNNLPWSLSQSGDYPSGGGVMGKIRSNPGGFFDNLASHLGQAGAYWSGDWDTGAAIGNGRNELAARMAAAQAEAQKREVRQLGDQILERDPATGKWVPTYSAPAKPQDPYRTKDNVGNVWEIGPDGKPRRIFTDTTPRMYVQGDRAIEVPNPYAGENLPNLVGKPFDQLPQSPQSAAPTIRNTPPPRLGSNGLPAVLTPEQYQATVNAMGKAQTDEWMRRNGIRIGQ